MISRNEIKQVKLLHRKKGRKELGQCIVEGLKGVEEVLGSKASVVRVYAVSGTLGDLSFEVDAIEVSPKDMEMMSALSSPSPILAVVELPVNRNPSIEVIRQGKSIYLDGIADPGNLGTILRTADWFGIQHVFLSEGVVDPYNPKVVQATMGSTFRMQIYPLKDLALFEHLMQSDPEFPVYGAVMDGQPLSRQSFQSAGMLVIGSESHGISKPVDAFLNRKITIPGMGGAESLNAAVATGILLHAWTRTD